jgi:hypothetical protein
VRKFQVLLKSDKNNEYFARRPIYFFCISFCSVILRMRNVADKRYKENQNTYFIFNNLLFRKSCRLRDNVEKYCRADQASDNNMAHAQCMLDTTGYNYKHSEYVILTAFPFNNGCNNTPWCYVISTLPGLLKNTFTAYCCIKHNN